MDPSIQYARFEIHVYQSLQCKHVAIFLVYRVHMVRWCDGAMMQWLWYDKSPSHDVDLRHKIINFDDFTIWLSSQWFFLDIDKVRIYYGSYILKKAIFLDMTALFTSAKMVSEVIQGREKMKYESDTKHEGIHMCWYAS